MAGVRMRTCDQRKRLMRISRKLLAAFLTAVLALGAVGCGGGDDDDDGGDDDFARGAAIISLR